MGNATWDGGSIWVRLNAECVKVNKMITPPYSKVEFQNKEKMNESEDEDATKLGHKNVLIF